MKNKRKVLYGLILMLAGVINVPVHAQEKNVAQDSVITKTVPTSKGPKGIVRTIKQDRKGNIWITSWEGVFKYDGKYFTNITSAVSSARFFSVLEDKEGNFWFGSVGSGVYYYDGMFRHFTTRDGLAGNEVTNIYEDKTGAVWLGTANGASRYVAGLPAGQIKFQSFKMSEAPGFTTSDSAYTGPREPSTGTDSAYTKPQRVHAATDSVHTGHANVHRETDSAYTGPAAVHVTTDSAYTGPRRSHAPTDSLYTGPRAARTATDSAYTGPAAIHAKTDSGHISVYLRPLPAGHWMHNDVNAIVEDKTGRFWFGTRGYATVYDPRLPEGHAKNFITITNTDGKPFTNVRSIVKDKKGNMWLGGNDGLWRYDGTTYTNFTPQFVGYIYEDKRGNIWTSSESATGKDWVLSRYDAKSLSGTKPTVTIIANKPMIFGILEDTKGNIWFGDFEGVHRYDGKNITDF